MTTSVAQLPRVASTATTSASTSTSTTATNATNQAAVTAGITTGAVDTKAPDQTMGKDAFLKLLVAQLRNQDPMNPVSGSDFVAQTATFSTVEKLTEISDQNADLLLAQRINQASGLIGRDVSYKDAAGTSGSGVVSSVTMAGAGPVLRIGSLLVPLAVVTEVRSVPSTAAATSTSSTTSGSTSA